MGAPPAGVDPSPSGRHGRPDAAAPAAPARPALARPAPARTAPAGPADPEPRDTPRPRGATGTAPGLPVPLTPRTTGKRRRTPADDRPVTGGHRAPGGPRTGTTRARPTAAATIAPAPRRRGLTRGLGAAVVGALAAGTMITLDTVWTGTADPLASADRLLQELPGGAEPTETVGPAIAPDAPRVDLAAAVAAGEEAGAQNGATVGVAAIDTATGELAPGSSGDQRFDTASLAKLFVVVDMLQRQRDGDMTLGARDLRLVHAALSSSSDPAMNALWTQYDGPGAITRVTEAIGLEDTSPPEDTSQWGEVQTSARDMAKLLRHIQVELPPPDRDLMLGSMGQAVRIAGDGFDQAFGFLDGRTPVKQGWMCCIAGRAEVHSAGVVDGRYMVAVLTSQPPGYDQARQVVNAAAGAVRERLGPVPDAR
ncbi:serine hydrolase [Actinomycetospora straminea]|uniref:serine hydrolase n=1 Tax=Actinomycetospora straminea TaxID=663607 RepID=UPI002366452C|nr:serine hydrolase [Actinomycetospora straminea]MDD7932305.1 hypothetical protein [Actinomycetospora straminea]